MQYVLQTIISGPNVGIMIPIPQYPLYSAAIELYGGREVPYYLSEKDSWGTSVAELKKSLDIAKENGIDTRALCIINPGNPTGQCLTEDNMKQVFNTLITIDYKILSSRAIGSISR